MIETDEIKLSPKKLLGILFMQYGSPWLIAILVGIALFVVLGFSVDIRFFVVALIWIFLVVPLLVAFLYFYYALDPLTALNAIPHKIRYDEKEITVVVIDKKEEEEVETSKEADTRKEKAERKEPSLGNEKCVKVGREELKFSKRGTDYYLLFFGKKGWLYFPILPASPSFP